MEGQLVNELVNMTGCDAETACMYLQKYRWNLPVCLEALDQNQIAATANVTEVKKLARGISKAPDNENLILKARNAIAKDFENNRVCKVNHYYVATPDATFLLPDFTMHGPNFRCFLERDLIEKSVMTSLENSSRLNWWCNYLGENYRLWPLSTTGDGNCLLHAASLSSYGFHDRMLTLRHALYRFMTECGAMEAIKRRWRWQQTKANEQTKVEYSEEEWEQEWNMVVDISSAKKRKSNQQGIYESLEEIHIFVLAHVLQRVIIVISETILKDSYNQPLAPINFGGIYLPFECTDMKSHTSPILLTYDMAHFSALVFMDKNLDSQMSTFYVPVTDCMGDMLPIQFAFDPGYNFNWDHYSSTTLLIPENNDQINLLKPFLDIVDLSGNPINADNDFEDDFEKHRYIEYSDQIDQSDDRKKSGKQLTVFGSIGKSMGQKLKRNFGSLTKLGGKSKTKDEIKGSIACAKVPIKRHAYQTELVQNYLKFAVDKFISEKLVPEAEKLASGNAEQARHEGLLRCISNNCNNYGTCITKYKCASCFVAQKQEESKKEEASFYEEGKSKFYTALPVCIKDSTDKIVVDDQNHNIYDAGSTVSIDCNNKKTDLNDNASVSSEELNKKIQQLKFR